EVDDARRIDAHLLDVLLVDHDVAALLELEALDDVGVRHFALAVRTPALLLNARLTFAVQLVEAQCRRGIGRGKHFHRNVHQRNLEIALPLWSRCHTLLYFSMIGAIFSSTFT